MTIFCRNPWETLFSMEYYGIFFEQIFVGLPEGNIEGILVDFLDEFLKTIVGGIREVNLASFLKDFFLQIFLMQSLDEILKVALTKCPKKS